MMDERVWHYIKPNETTRIPRRHIFLDTEALKTRTRKGHRQSWRVGVAAFHRADKGRQPVDELLAFATPAALWTQVDAWTKPRHRTVLWAHNLGYDVRISEAFTTLPALGWTVVAHNLANRGTWIQWRKGQASLLMVDSSSVFPTTLAEVGKTFRLSKLPLPDNRASLDEWTARCVGDVAILRRAILSYLSWLETEDLGNWQMTGAGQSYAVFRHRFLTHRMLVHADMDALEAERAAMWTGRCEAYWRGRIGREGFEEWDLSLAYARIAQREQVPVRLIGPAGPIEDLAPLLRRARSAVLAEVEVECSEPVLPTKVDGRMVWPVGTFTTTVWQPELEAALRAGCRLRPIRAWLYSTAPALKSWADWIIDALTSPESEFTAWQKLILKHWVRALIGRFGMSYQKWEKFGRTDNLDVLQGLLYDTRTQETRMLTHIGNAVSISGDTVEWDQSQPAITGYIMSACRVWLWDLRNAIGPEAVRYVDTDALYVTGDHHHLAAAVAATELGQGLRLKTSHRRGIIMGPRQIITGDRPRISGLPHRSTRMPNGTYAGEVWQSLSASLQAGDPGGVNVADRTWTVRGVDHRRLPGPDGWTLPIQVRGGERVNA